MFICLKKKKNQTLTEKRTLCSLYSHCLVFIKTHWVVNSLRFQQTSIIGTVRRRERIYLFIIFKGGRESGVGTRWWKVGEPRDTESLVDTTWKSALVVNVVPSRLMTLQQPHFTEDSLAFWPHYSTWAQSSPPHHFLLPIKYVFCWMKLLSFWNTFLYFFTDCTSIILPSTKSILNINFSSNSICWSKDYESLNSMLIVPSVTVAWTCFKYMCSVVDHV